MKKPGIPDSHELGADVHFLAKLLAIDAEAASSTVEVQLQIKVRGIVKVYVNETLVGTANTEAPSGEPLRATLAVKLAPFTSVADGLRPEASDAVVPLASLNRSRVCSEGRAGADSRSARW